MIAGVPGPPPVVAPPVSILGDADDDSDGVLDGSDSAPLDPLACSDVDLDLCDDCSGGLGANPLDDGLESLEGLGPEQHLAVDKEGGGPVDADATGLLKVRIHGHR